MVNSIVVDQLSKKYDISKLQRETQLREALVNFARRTLFGSNRNNVEIWALKNVTFSVGKGEVIGIIGRNGAGKSTLLKILSKITYPTTGTIKVQGKVGSLLEVGTGFHDELSGRENIFLNGSILGMKKKEVKKKLDAIVAFAEIERFLDTPIKRYSSGMRLRLGFSVAAHLETDILFVDEILSVGDIAFQKKCLNTMGDFHKTGRTVLFVSHNMPTVESLCPRVIWIEEGELKEDGRAEDVITNFMSMYAVTEKTTGLDFENVYEREGTGDVLFTRIEFLNMDGSPKDLIRSGDSLKVRLYYQVNQTVSYPDFNIRLYTERGVTVASFGNKIVGRHLPKLHPGTGYADVDINFLNMNPDRYYLNLWIQGPNKQFYDHLVHCTILDVEESNYYQTGLGINKGYGITFLPYVWSFEDNNVLEGEVDKI